MATTALARNYSRQARYEDLPLHLLQHGNHVAVDREQVMLDMAKVGKEDSAMMVVTANTVNKMSNAGGTNKQTRSDTQTANKRMTE